VVLLRAEGAVVRDLVVADQGGVGDLLVAEEGCGRLWRVACGRLCCLCPGAIVVVCCYPEVVVLFGHRNDVEEALAYHAVFRRTLDRCYGSRYRCNAGLEDSTRRDPYRRFLRLEQVAGLISSLDLFGESRVRGCLGILASPRAWTVQDGP